MERVEFLGRRLLSHALGRAGHSRCVLTTSRHPRCLLPLRREMFAAPRGKWSMRERRLAHVAKPGLLAVHTRMSGRHHRLLLNFEPTHGPGSWPLRYSKGRSTRPRRLRCLPPSQGGRQGHCQRHLRCRPRGIQCCLDAAERLLHGSLVIPCLTLFARSWALPASACFPLLLHDHGQA